MKKIIATVLSVLCVCATGLGLVACEEKEIINAYDIAVKNGFVGTEQEWLSSLKGANGANGQDLDIGEVYDKAVAEGYDKDFLTFLKEYLDVNMQEDNDTQMIAKNLSSVMSVCAGFKTTKITQGGWPNFTTKQQVSYSASEGSAVVISLNKEAGNAVLLTNYHVIYEPTADAENGISDCIFLYPYGARERFYTGSKDLNGDGVITDGVDRGDVGGDGIRATFVGGALYYDIAILEISGSEYLKTCEVTAATIGSSETVRQGEKVFAIGNANGLGISVTAGILSVPSETIALSALDGSGSSQSFRVMRTDAAINHGNSGGALFNARGELIGITNAKSVDDDTDALGYALPITQVSYVVNNILANKKGTVQVAWLGITSTVTASKSVINANGGLDIVEEITIAEVITGQTAEGYQPGAALNLLKVGDILQSVVIGGVEYDITRNYRFGEVMLNARVGETIQVTVVRDGKVVIVPIPLKAEDFTTRK